MGYPTEQQRANRELLKVAQGQDAENLTRFDYEAELRGSLQ
jgi:hypothetical protein